MSNHEIPLPSQWHTINVRHSISLYSLALCLALSYPGALAGGALTWLVWRVTKPVTLYRWLVGGLAVGAAWIYRADLNFAWPLHILSSWAQRSPTPDFSSGPFARSIIVEAILGPVVLLTFEMGNVFWSRTIHAHEWHRYHALVTRKKALERQWPGPQAAQRAGATSTSVVHLGTEVESRRSFDLAPTELGQHVFLPGASGSGKTTTLVRLCDGALAAGHAVIIVDCKGSGLGAASKKLAKSHHVAYTVVDPHDSESVGYDPCSGKPAAVANKIIGAFTFSGEAEIYKQVAMEVIPLICKALVASKSPVTLDAIYDALNRGALAQLARRSGVGDALRTRLEDLESGGGVGAAGYAGLQHRLGALMEGTFGELFRQTPSLDWAKQVQTPQVTYLSLSATAASEDVELFGRVITQDLKQLCDGRMRALDKGTTLTPVLIVYDEFAALREATQIVDLLLQARQARTPLVVATQFLPTDDSIRRPLMSAGVLIAHRLESEDAERIAAQFGTHTSPMLTAQVDYELGTSEKGSVRYVDEYNVHPNDLRALPNGTAAVLTAVTNRRAIVAVEPLA
jgi:hypothetical protein